MVRNLKTYILLIFLISCGKQGVIEEVVTIHNGQSAEILNIYFGSMSEFEANVYYEQGASPYAGNRLNGKPYWDFFEKNASSLLKAESRGVSLNIPKALSQMTEIPAIGKSSWTAEEIYNLAKNQNMVESTSEKGTVGIFFLKGNFKEGDQVKTSVMGVHLTNTNIIAIFKEKLEEIKNSQGLAVARFSEQSVIIHEFGHAMGLVNNGLTPKSDHHDAEHGSHCKENTCVMYYLNEGSNDMAEFIRNYVTTGDEDLFDSQCLNDAHQRISQ